MMRVALLGATGSIGAAALSVARTHPDRIRLVSLAARRQEEALLRAAEEFGVRRIALGEPDAAARARARFGGEVLEGPGGLAALAADPGADVVVNALVGGTGLAPTVAALEAGKRVALANKESIVMAGELLVAIAARTGGTILPVDSEHSAILQCLQGEDPAAIARLILTASGGPFLRLDRTRFGAITKAQALNHPTWRMGNKITIDSATLMNKGLEVIEAHWLFGVERDRIEVVIHPQSIIHSMVEFVDGSIKAQLGVPDMKIPIAYALTYPERPPGVSPRVDFGALREMTFFPPDLEKFRCLALAYRALETGGTAPAVLNAANEAAVELFLEERLPFTEIPALIEEALAAHAPVFHVTLEDLIRADREARDRVFQRAAAYSRMEGPHASS